MHVTYGHKHFFAGMQVFDPEFEGQIALVDYLHNCRIIPANPNGFKMIALYFHFWTENAFFVKN